MAKKTGTNSKVEAANARKASAKAVKDAQKAAQMEEKEASEWSKGSNSRAEIKKADEERKQQEAAAKKAEKKRLEALEDHALVEDKSNIRKLQSKAKKEPLKPWEEALKPVGKKKNAKGSKVTLAMIQQAKEDEESKKTTSKCDIVFEDQVQENRNRHVDFDQEARNIDEALDLLSISKGDGGKHPERRMKAAYKAFEEGTLPQLKEEYPGLKLSQYKQKLFEMWKRSPQNPMNQEALPYNHKSK